GRRPHPPGTAAAVPRPECPPPRTLQRWLRRAGLTPPAAVLSQHPAVGRAAEPHQVWQMDAAEQLKLSGGGRFCWLRLADECSGAILATALFAPARWAKVPDTQAQQAIRDCLARWGCPRAVRVDNGIPWGTSNGLPSELRLWLA